MDYEVTVPEHMGPGEPLRVVTEGGDVVLRVPSPCKMPPDRCVRFQGPTPESVGAQATAGPPSGAGLGTSGSQTHGSCSVGHSSSPLLLSGNSLPVDGAESSPVPAPPPPSRQPRPRRPRYSMEMLPARRTALRKMWSKRQLVTIGGYIFAGITHATLLSRRVIGQYLQDEPIDGELGTTIFFWVVWLATLIDGAIFMRSDPRDQGGEPSQVRCSACKQPVRSTSKHCFQCNECIVDFDHHCYYLNTCVGNRNYKSYFCLINGAAIMIATLTAQAFIVGIRLFQDRGGHQVGEDVVGSLCLLAGVFFFPGVFFLGHLCCLHYYLCWKGITTFEHWMGRPPRPFNARQLTQSFLTQSFQSHTADASAHTEAKAGTMASSAPITPILGGNSQGCMGGNSSVIPSPSMEQTPRSANQTPRSAYSRNSKGRLRSRADSLDSSNSALASRLSTSHWSLGRLLREEAQWATYGPPMPADPPVRSLSSPQLPEAAESDPALQTDIGDPQLVGTSSTSGNSGRTSKGSRTSNCIPAAQVESSSDVELRDSQRAGCGDVELHPGTSHCVPAAQVENSSSDVELRDGSYEPQRLEAAGAHQFPVAPRAPNDEP